MSWGSSVRWTCSTAGRRIERERGAPARPRRPHRHAGELRATADKIARDIAAAAPLAVRSIRATMRAPLLDAVRQAVEREAAEQQRLQQTR